MVHSASMCGLARTTDSNRAVPLCQDSCRQRWMLDPAAPDAGFGVDTNRVTFLHATGREEALPLMTKVALAREIIDRVVPFVAG